MRSRVRVGPDLCKGEVRVIGEILGPDLLIVLLVVAVAVLFGGSRIPKFARSLGQARSEFHKGITEGEPPSGDSHAG
jgi:sec-independent protein translocase protein TatA